MRLEEARNEILDKISHKIGYSIREDALSPSTRQAITSLANIWRNTIFMKQLAMGEKSRAEQIKSYSLVAGAVGLLSAIIFGLINFSLSCITVLVAIVVVYYLYKQYQETTQELTTNLQEISSIEDKISSKIDELSERITKEQKLGWIKQNIPMEKTSFTSEPMILELRCPKCGASLPMPTTNFIQCKYCGTILTIKDIGSQIKSLIESI